MPKRIIPWQPRFYHGPVQEMPKVRRTGSLRASGPYGSKSKKTISRAPSTQKFFDGSSRRKIYRVKRTPVKKAVRVRNDPRVREAISEIDAGRAVNRGLQTTKISIFRWTSQLRSPYGRTGVVPGPPPVPGPSTFTGRLLSWDPAPLTGGTALDTGGLVPWTLPYEQWSFCSALCAIPRERPMGLAPAIPDRVMGMPWTRRGDKVKSYEIKMDLEVHLERKAVDQPADSCRDQRYLCRFIVVRKRANDDGSPTSWGTGILPSAVPDTRPHQDELIPQNPTVVDGPTQRFQGWDSPPTSHGISTRFYEVVWDHKFVLAVPTEGTGGTGGRPPCFRHIQHTIKTNKTLDFGPGLKALPAALTSDYYSPSGTESVSGTDRWFTEANPKNGTGLFLLSNMRPLLQKYNNTYQDSAQVQLLVPRVTWAGQFKHVFKEYPPE